MKPYRSDGILFAYMGLSIAICLLLAACNPVKFSNDSSTASASAMTTGEPGIKKLDDVEDDSELDAFECSPQHKVKICHVPPGNSAAQHSICVDRQAVMAHTSHGAGAAHGGEDYLGDCHKKPCNGHEDDGDDVDDGGVSTGDGNND